MLVPAVFNPAGTLAFEPLKTSLLRAGAVIAAAAWLVRRAAPSKPGTVEVGAHPVVRAGLAFIGVAAFSTVLSVEPQRSFFGEFARGMGWLTLAACGVLLLCAADLLVDEQRRERAVTALVVGAVIPCAYWLVQKVGYDPIAWTALGEPGSTLASPTFVGGYLVLAAPFALYRVIGSARSASLAYAGWLGLLLVICAVTLMTTIRGAILGLAVGVIALVLLASPRRRIGRMEIAAAAGVLVVALGLAVVALGSSGATGLERFLSIARAGDSSIERLTVWRDSVGILLADPLRAVVGFGPEAQQVVLERGEATVRLTQTQQWDRAHNLLLDTWLTGGILAVAALVWLLATAFRSAWRARESRGLLPAAVIAALLGHLVEVSFAFETVSTAMVFWLLLGLAASLTPRFRPVGAAGPRARRWVRRTWVGVLAALALVPLLITPAVADALYGQARRSDYLSGARLEEAAASWAPWVEELPRAAGLDWQRVAAIRDDAAARGRAEADLVEAAARAPAEPSPELRLARWYLLQGDAARAEAACQRALALGPYRTVIWDTCAQVAGAQGDAHLADLRHAHAEELRH